MQKLDKYMTDIIRLNNIIQEKDQMILNLKLDNCDLRDQVTKSRTAGNQATQPVPICPAETDAITLQTDTRSDANSYSSKLKSNMAPGTSKDESNMFVQIIETKQNVGHVSEVSKNNGFTAFRGASNPLSNFYQFKFRPSSCEILNTGKMFSSIEQAYAYGKANFHDDKKRCQLIL